MRTDELGLTTGIPVISGSGSRDHYQAGSIYKQVDTPFSSIADLRSMVAERVYRIRIDPSLGDNVEAARKAKNRLKKLVQPTA